MLRVFEIRLPLDHSPADLRDAVVRTLAVASRDILSLDIRRQAVDARRGHRPHLIYTVDLTVRDERRITAGSAVTRIIPTPDESYILPATGREPLSHRPLVVGSGPAGLFAGLLLAQCGYRPIVLERGKTVQERCVDVKRFWDSGVLDPESNAQFGEGGAGTFSDGKLTTQINDPRCRRVLEELVRAGAPQEILVSGKPHIGTNRLRTVVQTLRAAIVSLGGQFRFGARLTGIRVRDNRLAGAEIASGDAVGCQAMVVAIGHSARDTFEMLLAAGVTMTPKAFSAGVRIEHLQSSIDTARFGDCAGHPRLGPADYKLAYHAPNGRSAYTFCMCPGGEVIAAASEQDGVVTNGMSLWERSGRNANAAVLVNVGPGDFPGTHFLSGFEFQRQWERAAFGLGGSTFSAPVQRLGDFLARRPSEKLGSIEPTYRPGVRLSDLHACLPPYVADTIGLALPVFGRQLKGFDLPDAVLTGVETRSSCPVRMTRDETLQSSVGGIYPAGEGAGYAGGIVSAAVDGMRVAEAIVGRFAQPPDAA